MPRRGEAQITDISGTSLAKSFERVASGTMTKKLSVYNVQNVPEWHHGELGVMTLGSIILDKVVVTVDGD